MIFLITGAAGFIGAKTSEILLKQGHQVVGVDNMNDYYDLRIKKNRLDQLESHSSFQFHPIDIENSESLEVLFKLNKFNAVINLAARAGVRYSLENPFIYAKTNYLGSLNLLDLMRKFDVPKYVMASTSSIYTNSEMPFKEESSVNEPISPYAASKKAAELIAYTYHHQFELDVTILRYFTVYGPSGRPDMSVLRFIKWIDEGTPILLYGDGTQSRDFTYINDIAQGTVSAALTNTGYEIINLGGGNTPVTMLELISKIENLLGKKAEINFQEFHSADVDSTQADNSKAKELLNWKVKTSLDIGLKETVDWYKENKNWLGEIDFL